MAGRYELIVRARTFRREPTRGEKLLWIQLRRGALGVHFRRQHVIGSFVADFACLTPKLVVEIDGPVHDEQVEGDAERQAYFEREGFQVLRFPADDVTTDIMQVVDRIRAALNSPLPLTLAVLCERQGKGGRGDRGAPSRLAVALSSSPSAALPAGP